MPEDHADVMAAAAEDGEEGISGDSFQRASRQAAVILHVSDHRFYRATPPQEFGNRSGDAAPGAADEDVHIFHTMAAIPSIHKGHVWRLIGQDFDLLQGFGQRMTVVGITWQRPHPDHEAASVGCGHADLGPELVTLVRLAFRYAIHRRLMQAVRL